LAPRLALILALASAGCRPGEEEVYADVAAGSGVAFIHTTGASGGRHLPETVAGGAGWIDYDGDGDLDLYCVNGNEHPDVGGPGTATNRLYRNDGGGRFQDVTEEAGVGDRGYGMGLAVGDYDNDGREDLYVTNFAPRGAGGNVLYHNEGGGRFRDVTAAAGTAPGGWSTSAAFLDYDGDGLLDLYVVRYVRYDPGKRCRQGAIQSYCGPRDFPGEPDVLYHNRGDGTFEDTSARAGIGFEDPAGGAGLGVIALDYDDDGDTDIFVSNDQGPNYLFQNRGGRFQEVALAAGVAYGPDGAARAGMGVDAGDLDLDGREELVVTNFADEPAGLFLAEGGGLFRDAASELGVAGPTLLPLGFGVVFTDFDLDGDLDLYIANGHVHDNIAELRPGSGRTFGQPDLLLENRGAEGFVDVSRAAGRWFAEARVGRAVAAADYDEDGDEDLFVLNAGGRGALLENRAPRRGGWLALRLRGTRSNRDGYGARVAVLITGEDGVERTRFFEVRSARSYAAACDPRVRVGLGPRPPRSARAIVRWPGPLHTVEEYRGILPGRTTEIVESPAEPLLHPVAFPRPPARAPALAASKASAKPASTGPLPRGEPPGPGLAAALERARRLRSSHRYSEALQIVQDAGAAEPAAGSNREARYLRAELLFNLYRPREAAEILQPLLGESPSSNELRLTLARVRADLGSFGEALALFEGVAASGAALDGEARRSRAAALRGSGRPAEARSEIAALLAADPWFEAAYLDLGRLLGELGQPAQAAPFLERYRRGEPLRRREETVLELEMQGQPARAEHERGELELSRGRAFQALTHWNRALELDPSFGPSFLALARLSGRLERQEDGLQRLRAAGNAPEVAAARREIEATLEGEDEIGRTRAAIRARMAGRPLSGSIGELVELARALAATGEGPRAREVALFAAEIAPRDREAQRAAADLFGEPGDSFIRLWALERAVEAGPADPGLRARRDALARELAVSLR
jgi:tetratricopeptide (TPR) repeat protein